MRQATAWWMFLGGAGLLCSFVGYAVRTLASLNRKTLYPILRVVDRDGQIDPMILPSLPDSDSPMANKYA